MYQQTGTVESASVGCPRFPPVYVNNASLYLTPESRHTVHPIQMCPLPLTPLPLSQSLPRPLTCLTQLLTLPSQLCIPQTKYPSFPRCIFYSTLTLGALNIDLFTLVSAAATPVPMKERLERADITERRSRACHGARTDRSGRNGG